MTVEQAHGKLGLDTLEFDREVIGQLLLSARQAIGATLKHVEAGSGITASHIWNIEKGKKEVAIERLVKLACFYGFPVGLLLEAGVRVKCAPIQSAAAEQSGEIAKILKWPRPSKVELEMMGEFCAGLAVIVTYLLRSTRPGFLIEAFVFPTHPLKHRFRLLTSKIEYSLPPEKRMEILMRMPIDPAAALTFMGLLRKKDFEDFKMVVERGLFAIDRPWAPKPTQELADFRQAINVAVMSLEEFEYINSLRRSADGKVATSSQAKPA